MIGDKPITINEKARVVFDPSYGRGIYLPTADFKSAATAINAVFYQWRSQMYPYLGVC